MTALQAALLGVVQGLTEFLPVSSSAHLILARAFFGFDAGRFGLAFDVACHVGTLGAVAVYFRRELRMLAGGLPAAFSSAAPPAAGRLLHLLVAGTIPIVVAALLFDDYVEHTLRTPEVAAVALAAGAIFLFVAERAGSRTRDEQSLTIAEALAIGAAQAAALVPGVSRSGATIALAMLLGLRRDAAARFVFLLSIPAILAAAAKELPALAEIGLAGQTAGLFAIGIVTSGVVGYLTVKYFIRYLAGHSLDGFAWYRLALAAVTGVWLVRA